MNILEVNKFFYKKGGSETYFFAVRDLLKEYGDVVMDFSMNHEKNEVSKFQPYFTHPVYMENKGILKNIHTFCHMIYSTHVSSKLTKLMHEHGQIDIAHLHNIYYQLSPSVINVLKDHEVPIVMTLHDYKIISPNYNLFTNGKIDESTKPDKYFQVVKNKSIKNSYLKSFVAFFEQWFHKKITKLYDAVDIFIAPSKFLADLIISYGIPKEKVRQLYNFIPLEKYQPKYEPGDYYVFVGRFTEEKGIRLLIEEFKKMPDKKLVVIGSGDQEYLLRKLVEDGYFTQSTVAHNCGVSSDHKSQSNIEIVGPVYAPKVFDCIREAKALIIPSIWYENNPMVVLEAMALGKPVIGANFGGIPELIDDGKTGMIYNPHLSGDLKNKLEVFEKMDIKSMGQAGRKKVESIADPNMHYEKLMEIFNEASGNTLV